MRALGVTLSVIALVVIGATAMFFALKANPHYVATDTAQVEEATSATDTATAQQIAELQKQLEEAKSAMDAASAQQNADLQSQGQQQAPGEVNVQQWMNLKSEVDVWCPVGEIGKWHCDQRITTDPGEVTAMGVEFRSALSTTLNRFVCDDTCGKIYLLYPDQRVMQLQIVKTYGPNFDYQTLTQAEQQLAASYGVNVAGSEILAQNFVQDFAAPAGSVLVITGADDPTKGAFRGVFASSVFVSPEATPYGGGE